MLLLSVANLFKYKLVGSIIIFANLRPNDEVKIARQFFDFGLKVTFAKGPSILERSFELQGIIFGPQESNNVNLSKVHNEYFTQSYKWLMLNKKDIGQFNGIRYDADIVTMRRHIENSNETGIFDLMTLLDTTNTTAYFDDVFFHPRDGATFHEWAHSSNGALEVTHDWERIQRRKNVKKYPFRISAPVAYYSESTYHGTFAEYLEDMTASNAAIRCAYAASSLIVESVNATRVLKPALYWNSEVHNTSMIVMLQTGSAELSAGVLRMMQSRISKVDYILPIWQFSVGFTYLAERESSSNMYVEPFTAGVWWSCLAIGIILAIAQRVTSNNLEEREGAFMGTLATWLQQDASAVPAGLSGRWTFTVLSVCAMLVHAYYTSSIVSALMSTGRGGPKTLRALADSRYAIASEDQDFIRYSIFDFQTSWEDLEYLKKRKLTPNLYQDIKAGVQLVKEGSTAYHAEYHQLVKYLNILSDDEICKIQRVDTIPEVMSWITTSPKGQWTNLLRVAAAWMQETGHANRLIQRFTNQVPSCRAALLAERVNFFDIAPLLAVKALAMVISVVILGLEIAVEKWTRKFPDKNLRKSESEISVESLE